MVSEMRYCLIQRIVYWSSSRFLTLESIQHTFEHNDDNAKGGQIWKGSSIGGLGSKVQQTNL